MWWMRADMFMSCASVCFTAFLASGLVPCTHVLSFSQDATEKKISQFMYTHTDKQHRHTYTLTHTRMNVCMHECMFSCM